MLKRKITIWYADYYKSGGKIVSFDIKFNRFSKLKNRRIYRALSPSLEYFIHVNRFGIIKMRGVRRKP